MDRRATIALLFASAVGCAQMHVPPGEVGVRRTPEGADPHVYIEGDWPIGVYDHVTLYDARSQERTETVYAPAREGLDIEVRVVIRFHIVAPEAVQLDVEIGPHYYAVLVAPTLKAQARHVAGRHTPEDLLDHRDVAQVEIRHGIQDAFAGRHVVVEAVEIRHIELVEHRQRPM